MSGYLQRLAERSGLVPAQRRTAVPAALERSAEVAAAQPDAAPEKATMSVDPGLVEFDSGPVEPMAGVAAPVSLADEAIPPETPRRQARGIRPAPDIRRHASASPNEAVAPEPVISRQDLPQEQYPVHAAAVRSPSIPEHTESHNSNVDAPARAPATAGPVSFSARAPGTPRPQPQRTQPEVPAQQRPPVFTATPAMEAAIEPPDIRGAEPGEPAPAASSSAAALSRQASTSLEEALEFDGARRRPVGTGRVQRPGRRNAVPERAGGRIEVRIGSVSLDVHQPAPLPAEPHPKPASGSGRTGGGNLHRHYLKGW